jgi:hypothetical protein
MTSSTPRALRHGSTPCPWLRNRSSTWRSRANCPFPSTSETWAPACARQFLWKCRGSICNEKLTLAFELNDARRLHLVSVDYEQPPSSFFDRYAVTAKERQTVTLGSSIPGPETLDEPPPKRQRTESGKAPALGPPALADFNSTDHLDRPDLEALGPGKLPTTLVEHWSSKIEGFADCDEDEQRDLITFYGIDNAYLLSRKASAGPQTLPPLQLRKQHGGSLRKLLVMTDTDELHSKLDKFVKSIIDVPSAEKASLKQEMALFLGHVCRRMTPAPDIWVKPPEPRGWADKTRTPLWRDHLPYQDDLDESQLVSIETHLRHQVLSGGSKKDLRTLSSQIAAMLRRSKNIHRRIHEVDPQDIPDLLHEAGVANIAAGKTWAIYNTSKIPQPTVTLSPENDRLLKAALQWTETIWLVTRGRETVAAIAWSAHKSRLSRGLHSSQALQTASSFRELALMNKQAWEATERSLEEAKVDLTGPDFCAAMFTSSNSWGRCRMERSVHWRPKTSPRGCDLATCIVLGISGTCRNSRSANPSTTGIAM